MVDFGGGEIVASEDDATQLSLTLSGVDFDAVAFTDRPERQVANVSPDHVAEIINGASDDPVNAALVARLPESLESTQLVVTLNSASFDAETETLALEAVAITNDDVPIPLPVEAGQSLEVRSGNLFIDDLLLVFDLDFEQEEGATCAGRACSSLFAKCRSGCFCLPMPPSPVGICWTT